MRVDNRFTALVVLTSTALALSAAPVQATDVTDEALVWQGTEYVCTGVAGSQDNPRWDDYPLKLVFAAKENLTYLAHVSAVIRDGQGNVVLEASCPAPWLLVDLPPGTYQARAEFKGEVREATFEVDQIGQTTEVLEFPSSVG